MTDLFRIRFATCNNEVFDNVEIDDIVMYPHNSNNGLFIGGTNSNHITIKDHITRVTGDLQILGNIFDSNNNTYSLGGDDLSLDSNTILNYHIKDSNVSVNKLESITGGGDYVVTSYKPLVIRPKIGAGLELVPGEIDNSNVLIGNTYIIDKSITTRTINDSAITTTTIADFAVSNGKLGEACISRTKFQDTCIFSGAISDNAVISRTIQNNAIITSKIPDQAITKEKIKLQAVTTDRLDTDAVTTVKILDENVTNRKLADNCVTTNKIFESNITTDKAYRITGTGDAFVLQNNPTITGTANINGDISLFKSTTNNNVGPSHSKITWYSSSRDISTNASAEIDAIYGDYEGNYYGYDDAGSIVFRTVAGFGPPIDRMMVRNNGNIGIGTTNPDRKLHIIGDGSQIIKVENGQMNDTNNATAEIAFTTKSFEDGEYCTVGVSKARGMFFHFKGDKMNITENGNVGVGTNNPNAKLDVYGDIALFKSTIVNSVGPSHGKITWYSSARDINTNASAEIDVVYGDYENNNYGWDDHGSIIFRSSDDIGSPIDRMIIRNNGDIGIGTNNPTAKLDVNGILKAGNIYSNGTRLSSDDRLKSDEVFITNALGTVNKIRPQEYNKWSTIEYNSDSNAISQKESGIIAQELYIDAPELRHLITLPIGSDSNSIEETASNYASYNDLQNDPIWPEWSGDSNNSNSIAYVNYTGLIPYTIQAIKELHHIVCDLQKENKELRDIIYSSSNV
jgi:hypothetical protein